VAIGVAAVQLVPFLELTGYSLRQTLTYAESAAFPLERRGLLLLLVPHFFGPSLGDFWGMNSLTESYGYLGIITAPLAALGVLASRGHPWRLFWLLLAVGGLLLSLGERTVLHGWLYELLPAFERLRVPGRFLFYVTVGTAVLAAFGLDSLAAPTRLRPALRFLLRGSRLLLLLVGLAVALLLFAVLTNQDKDPLIFRRTIEALESGKAAWDPPPMPATMREVLQAYETRSATMPGRWKALPAERWEGNLDFFGTERPAGAMAWSFLFDIVHHRGQISTYLRPMGSTVPQIYGPSGDEP